MALHYGDVYGIECCDELLRSTGSGRTSLYERYHYLHSGNNTRPVCGIYGRRSGSVPRRPVFYPLPMFVSLATHGLQAVVISVFSHYIMKDHPVLASGIGVTVGAVIMVVGYSLGRAFIYSTPEYALLKLPYQILQAAVGAVVGMLLCWKCGINNLYHKVIRQ